MKKYVVEYRVAENSTPVPLKNIGGTLYLDNSFLEIFRFFDTLEEAQNFIQENSGTFVLPGTQPAEITLE